MKQIALLAAFAIFAAGCESDDNRNDQNDSSVRGTGTSTDKSSALTESDRQFITDAASSDLFEIQSSQWALQQQNVDSELSRIAQMMVEDHTKASQDLRKIAQGKGITVPQKMLANHQQMYDRLRSASGNQIATQYRQMQLQAHQEGVALFQRASQNLQDPELRQFAQRTLPVLREHLNHVQQYRPGSSSGQQPMMNHQRPSNGVDQPVQPSDDSGTGVSDEG
jgi:putative membrane protein